MALDLPASAVLFDMDGTLVDSTAVVESMWARLAADQGLDAEVVIAFSHGRPTIDSLAHFLPHLTHSELTALEQDFTAEEVRRTDGIVEVPGAAALMRLLLGMGAPVAVVTSASVELATSRMVAAGVPIPPILVTPQDTDRGKPAPDGYLRAADGLGVPVARCVVFEDAEAGIAAGVASGACVVVVGQHASALTVGLPRVPDLACLTVSAAAEGLRLRTA